MKSFLVAFLICLLSMTVFADTASSNKLIVNYIDVGQGDSELIECNGQFMLVDAGEKDKGTVVVNYLKTRGVEKFRLCNRYTPSFRPYWWYVRGFKYFSC